MAEIWYLFVKHICGGRSTGSGVTCLGPTLGTEQGQRLISFILRCQVNISAAFGKDEKIPAEQFKLLNSEELVGLLPASSFCIEQSCTTVLN